jgi:hypothetical protein
MSDSKGKSGTYAFRQSPPGKLFLGLGVLLLLINHLSVVLGNGLILEALIVGTWTGFMGTWALLLPRTFDAIWGWAKPSTRREVGLGLFTMAVAVGLAEAIALFAYGQHLWN